MQVKNAIVPQDSAAIDAPCESLLGIATPYLFLLMRNDSVPPGSSRVVLRSMRDFVGMEQADDATKRALTDFSFYMATGNMDEAYKAVKLVANPYIWENMAQMCVKSKRMDVAAVCLGHMQHARGARAIRESGSREPELEANVAQVAVQLGLLSDAARLYSQCGRHDLLAKLYQVGYTRMYVRLSSCACVRMYVCVLQDAGAWDKATAVTARHDKTHVKTLHYQHAKFLESTGDIAVSSRIV